MEKVGRAHVAWYAAHYHKIAPTAIVYSSISATSSLPAHDDIDISTIASPEHLHTVCIRLFADQMTERIGIRCCIDAQNTATTLIFPDCPFCSDQLPGCRVLFGVVKSFISWLYHLPEGDILNSKRTTEPLYSGKSPETTTLSSSTIASECRGVRAHKIRSPIQPSNPNLISRAGGGMSPGSAPTLGQPLPDNSAAPLTKPRPVSTMRIVQPLHL